MTLRRQNRPSPLNLVRRQDVSVDDPEFSPESPSTPSPSNTFSSSFFFEPTATPTASIESSTLLPRPTSIGPTAEMGRLPSSATRLADENTPAPTETQRQAEDFMGLERYEGNQELAPAAKGILITFSILGSISLIAIVLFLYRRRKARQALPPPVPEKKPLRSLLHLNKKPLPPTATTPSSPSLEDLIARPQSTHVPTYRITRAKDSPTGWTAKSYTRGHPSSPPRSNTLISSVDGSATNARPTTATDEDTDTSPTLLASRSSQATNPFDDPSLKKSYDLIQNRPRSTTLTDTNDWEQNPFVDPRDERFDPFGTLRDRAREEKRKYAARLRAERERAAAGDGEEGGRL